MKSFGRASAIGMLCFALSACATRSHSLPYGPENLTTPDRKAPEDSAYDTPLGPLDVVHLQVFRVPDLTGDYQVDAHGILILPLIGPVNVRDKSPDDFVLELKQLYGARYLQNPNITIRIVSSNNSNVIVEGGVRQAGVFALPGKTTLVGAIALAHGLDENNANPRRIAIFRKQGGHTVGAAFDLVSIHQGKMIDPLVYPGDTIIVDSDRLRQFYRDALQAVSAAVIFRNI